MKINTARYSVTSAFGAFAVGSCTVAYPAASFYTILMGSMIVGCMCAFAADLGEER